METLYFVLGMLSIFAVMIVAAVVWGIVKITTISKSIKNHEEERLHCDRSVWDRFQHTQEETDRRFEDAERNMHADLTHALEGIKNTLRIQAEETDRVYEYINSLTAGFGRQIADSVTQGKSYTDSRIDKLIDTYFAISEEKKQIIKG